MVRLYESVRWLASEYDEAPVCYDCQARASDDGFYDLAGVAFCKGCYQRRMRIEADYPEPRQRSLAESLRLKR